MGHPCDKNELRTLVCEYVTVNNNKTPLHNNKPGEDWSYNFMKRYNNLSFKKPEQLQKFRKVARNPYVIYDFYNKLNTIVVNNNIEKSFVFNADESGFKTDPSRLKAIGEGGKTLNRISGGSGRESISVLAWISADGSCVPPFIILKGVSVQARWTWEKAYPGTVYGVSQNGWVEEQLFFNWFTTVFVKHVEQKRFDLKTNAKALLLYDGHCSHISVRIIEIAIKHNITLFKFPSHLTDKLQPLDKCVFGRLKTLWEKK